MARKSLGRGIDALIPGSVVKEGEEITELDISKIHTNPYQPRQIFSEEKIKELAVSMKEHGIIQPLVVRRVDQEFQLVTGERRLRAAVEAGFQRVPVVIRSIDDRHAMEMSIVENVQREDLCPIEEADAFKRLIDEFKMTQDELAKRVGKSRSDVANTLRLLRLEKEIRKLVMEGKLTAGHARNLVGLDRKTQLKVAKDIISKGLSVRKVEEALSSKTKKDKSIRKNVASERRKDAEELLSSCLGSPVLVKYQGARGSIKISFFGEEDLERIVELIRAGERTD